MRSTPYEWSPPAPMLEISGWITWSVNDFTSVVNAAPMTTATARSTMFPCMRNALKPLNMTALPVIRPVPTNGKTDLGVAQ